MSFATLIAIERPVAIHCTGSDIAAICAFGDLKWELEKLLLHLPETDEEQTAWLSVEDAEMLKEAAEALEIKLHVEVLA